MYASIWQTASCTIQRICIHARRIKQANKGLWNCCACVTRNPAGFVNLRPFRWKRDSPVPWKPIQHPAQCAMYQSGDPKIEVSDSLYKSCSKLFLAVLTRSTKQHNKILNMCTHVHLEKQLIQMTMHHGCNDKSRCLCLFCVSTLKQTWWTVIHKSTWLPKVPALATSLAHHSHICFQRHPTWSEQHTSHWGWQLGLSIQSSPVSHRCHSGEQVL